jgi:hypothetical protein
MLIQRSLMPVTAQTSPLRATGSLLLSPFLSVGLTLHRFVVLMLILAWNEEWSLKPSSPQCRCTRCRSWVCRCVRTFRRCIWAGHQAACRRRVLIVAVHGRSWPCGLPPGGLHPIGADHCPEREQSRAWSRRLPRCFGRAKAGRARGCRPTDGGAQRILEPLTAPVEG